MQNSEIFAAVKLGTKEHMTAFYESGEVYMQTFRYFRQLELTADGRGDPNEYDTHYVAGDGLKNIAVTLKVNDAITGELKDEFSLGDGLIGISMADPSKFRFSHVFCCSAVDGKEVLKKHRLLDEKNFADGKNWAVLFDAYKFRERLFIALRTSKKCARFQSKAVSYYSEENFYGDLDCFCKRDAYSYQNEIRFAALFASDEAQKICIGSLKDIAMPPVCKTDFLNLSFRVENDRILFK